MAGVVIASLYVVWAGLPFDNAIASASALKSFRESVSKLDKPLVLPVFWLAFLALALHNFWAASLIRACFLDPALTFIRDFSFFSAGAVALIATVELYGSKGLWATIIESGLIVLFLSAIGIVFHGTLALPKYVRKNTLLRWQRWVISAIGILGLIGIGWIMLSLQVR